MSIVTLTSDYGFTDHYSASVKGALLRESDDIQIVDITHNIKPSDFFETAFILRNSYDSFPKKTIHLIAVQEITETGKLLAAEIDNHYFLCGDNGLVTLINPEIKITKVIQIDFRNEDSLFPARDVFARSAAHLARGGSIDILGRECKDYKQSTIVRPRITNEGSVILGSVVYVDNFGSLITNISKKTFKETGKERSFEILLPRGNRLAKVQESYYPSSLGSLVALFNSQGLLEIAMGGAMGKDHNGASTLLGLDVRDTVTINFI